MIVWNAEWIYRMVILFHPSGSSQVSIHAFLVFVLRKKTFVISWFHYDVQVESWTYLHIYRIFWFASSHPFNNLLLLVDSNQWTWNSFNFKLNWLLRWTLHNIWITLSQTYCMQALCVMKNPFRLISFIFAICLYYFYAPPLDYIFFVIVFLSSFEMTIARLFVLPIMFHSWRI